MTPNAGRPKLSLRVSVTDLCPLRCSYCRPAEIVPVAARGRLLSCEQITQFVSVLLTRYALRQVRLTGGEPLVRPRIEELVSRLAAIGVPDLALTTNGQQLAEKAPALKRAGLGRVNISLDSLSPATFAKLTGGGILEKTLAGIDAAQRAGLRPVKLNAVVLRGLNDREVAGLVRYAAEHDCEMRFLELMPIGGSVAGFQNRFVSSAEVRARLEEEFTLEPLCVNSEDTSRNFVARMPGGRPTIIGFISPCSEPFCAGCRRLRLTATGHLIGCLARPHAIPLVWGPRGDSELSADALCASVELAIGMKRRNGDFVQPRHVVEIGG